MLQIYKKIHKFCDVLSYFTNTKFVFTNNNVMVSLFWAIVLKYVILRFTVLELMGEIKS